MNKKIKESKQDRQTRLRTPGADPGFQVGEGGALKKLRRAEGGGKIAGVFRVKNHDFTPKNHIFSNFRVRPPPPGSAPDICKRSNINIKIRSLKILKGYSEAKRRRTKW